MIEALITCEEVALRLGLKRRAVQELTLRRAIPVVKLSKRCHRYRWSAVEIALEKITVKPVA